MKFDHIGLVVPKLDAGRAHLTELFSITKWTREFEDPVNGVFVQFGSDPSEVCYELIAPLGDKSPVKAALATGTRILNHVAYLVADLEAEAGSMARRRCVPAGPANPAVAYGGNRIQFFVSPLRFIIELIEAPHHRHDYLAQHLIGTGNAP